MRIFDLEISYVINVLFFGMTEKEWLLCFDKEASQFDFVLFTKKSVIIW